ncbi:MAG: two-component sensor histidine kinase [Frankiales bacterium]|jgi:signal transduction histidine kinase|nr:two-component sensor histidine kinase [Frankiales bacterium]
MRRQVALLVTATTLLVVVAFLLPLTLLLRTLAADRAVAQGLQEAQGLAVLVAVTPPDRLEAAVDLLDSGSPRAVTVFLPDGRALGAPAGPVSGLASSGRAFTADADGGREIYVPVDTERGRAVVRSYVPDTLLQRGVRAAVGVLAALGLGLLAVAVLVADRLARVTVRPVTALAGAALRLAAGDLTARVEPAGPPEVREVGAAVNALGRRIDELLVAERESVADLSHRLRTPLTALRLDAEGLRDPDEAARLGADVAAVERTVDEVIRTARRAVREGGHAECDAVAVTAERTAFWAVLAEDQGRPWHVVLPQAALPVRLSPADLGAALDALLGNVFAHTQDDAAVEVRVEPASGMVCVQVADRGPGIPSDAATRGRSGAGSTGLGLDIARRTCEAAGGRLRVEDRAAGGTSITMELGPP